ncbi:MAG: MBL fold metallo-hydrolase [Gemmatimonadota bacterium]|nr:MBL fold metallo-hydrolase [Gemmatimonadota bacterium]MDQ6885797.1 MBL fold metallo-hydrolase [Gemmatimonadota bacterium]
MISLEIHGDVTRIQMSSRRSRAVGYSASAFLVRGMLVDSGFPAIGDELASLLDRLRPSGAMITHQHEDHAGNTELLTRRRLPVTASPQTISALRRGPRAGWYRQAVWGRMRRLSADPIAGSTAGLELLPAPGHSADHHVVWDPERGTLFSGDLFLGVRVRVAHRHEDPRELARSVRAAAALDPSRMFDAHRGLVATPAPALRAKADWIEERIRDVERRAAEGWSDRAIARAVLGAEDFTYYVSRGDLSRINWVRSVRATAR